MAFFLVEAPSLGCAGVDVDELDISSSLEEVEISSSAKFLFPGLNAGLSLTGVLALELLPMKMDGKNVSLVVSDWSITGNYI